METVHSALEVESLFISNQSKGFVHAEWTD